MCVCHSDEVMREIDAQIQNPFLTAQSTQIESVISVPIKDFIHHYPRALFNDIPRVGAHFYDIPGSKVDANDTSGELGLALPGSLVGESVFRTAKLEVLTESASWMPLVSVVPECQSEW